MELFGYILAYNEQKSENQEKYSHRCDDHAAYRVVRQRHLIAGSYI
ncbi:hypothetical protein HMPREF1318_2362 [Actinomyces massiliensis F0489]|uniref:Uncharacterized protein n=1 Tax=Actinomyces massiliensis F0489 TaxID=1125718 RepID=J1HNR0_9ACTO|nr:hypothetical protein HMPREF1318_2362 [Actinomyces massiliensis F0489]